MCFSSSGTLSKASMVDCYYVVMSSVGVGVHFPFLRFVVGRLLWEAMEQSLKGILGGLPHFSKSGENKHNITKYLIMAFKVN